MKSLSFTVLLEVISRIESSADLQCIEDLAHQRRQELRHANRRVCRRVAAFAESFFFNGDPCVQLFGEYKRDGPSILTLDLHSRCGRFHICIASLGNLQAPVDGTFQLMKQCTPQFVEKALSMLQKDIDCSSSSEPGPQQDKVAGEFRRVVDVFDDDLVPCAKQRLE